MKRLLGDDVPRMVFADPPYGIAVVETSGALQGKAAAPFGGWKKHRETGGQGKVIASRAYPAVIGDGDGDTVAAALALCGRLWPNACQVWWGANHYCEQVSSSPGWIVWDKKNGETSFADAELAWTNQERPVRLFEHMWNGMVKASEHGEKRVHPTQKPVALAEWCFETYGTVGDLVFDPFLGSGMSVIAATKTARRVVGCELSPEYCDVVMQRFEDLTGQKARLQARSA